MEVLPERSVDGTGTEALYYGNSFTRNQTQTLVVIKDKHNNRLVFIQKKMPTLGFSKNTDKAKKQTF
ncbi:MAG: hypothetical protein HN778_08730 [Prolixibacteraceae bacterium]|nr:hypothetical protein [Prolixibacteraceae bacterium]MBT6766803.1 hypothetical protein [Prolixibacteraceae bacterium]MBT6997593.1 hypothetical protein [Prolixibacteraceae bacterium]MBT7394900.1 hypothetical protein [Prolixibacteraceae bacterium]